MENYYKQVSDERYRILSDRYEKFADGLNDLTKEPVTVFDPLPKKLIYELELIREVSKDLQKKKEEDISKAARAAEEAAEAAKKAQDEAAKQKEETDKEVEKEDS